MPSCENTPHTLLHVSLFRQTVASLQTWSRIGRLTAYSGEYSDKSYDEPELYGADLAACYLRIAAEPIGKLPLADPIAEQGTRSRKSAEVDVIGTLA